MQQVYGVIYATKPADHGRRVNWAMCFEMPEDAPAYTEERLARRFCELMGWSYILLKVVSPKRGRELLEAQQNRAEG